jgi:hypothetical protein
MAANPWDSRAGQYDRPSSSVPVRDVSARRETAPPARARSSSLDQRVADAERMGVIAVGAATILARIDAAIDRLHADGHGSPRAIYLVDGDLLAFREAHQGNEYRDVRVSSGATSKVYGATGAARAVRRAAK